jgi:hypothetical protein
VNALSTGVGDFDAAPPTIDRNQTFIGEACTEAARRSSGEIAEIILYSRELATEERQDVESVPRRQVGLLRELARRA